MGQAKRPTGRHDESSRLRRLPGDRLQPIVPGRRRRRGRHPGIGDGNGWRRPEQGEHVGDEASVRGGGVVVPVAKVILQAAAGVVGVEIEI